MDDAVRQGRVEKARVAAPARRLELLADVSAEAAALAEAASVRSPARLKQVERTLRTAQLELVRARLMLRVGDAVVSRLRIVESDAFGGRAYAALLLEKHVPIHVSMRVERGAENEAFYVGPFDVFGRRDDEAWAAAFEGHAMNFLEALARSAAMFGRLCREADGRWPNPPYGENVGALVEEVWLHEQLHGFGGMPGEAHGACDTEEELLG